ncbi:hypothetical protein SLS62_010690 [Diatrype stigma]|uniref:Uncharacterized protein n=1 Tax=Diatrype stigma TaxID=117547 RepID=A0AAN9UH56_9PEZI
MTMPRSSHNNYKQTVGLLGNALGIQEWDTASRRGLQDFVNSEYVRYYVTEVANAYLDKHKNPPSIQKIMEEALWYHNPTLDPEVSESMHPFNLAKAVDMARQEQNRQRRGRVCDGRVNSDEFYIALFAARLINHVERDRAAHLASDEMAWFPRRFHHKIAFAVALMYFVYSRPEWRYDDAFRKVRTASSKALSYLTCFRCPKCGQDYQDPKAGPLCGTCPLKNGEQLEFERARVRKEQMEQKLKNEVDDFFAGLGNPNGFVIVKDERP